MQKSKILFALSLTMLLCAGPWRTTSAQNVSVPLDLLRDYNDTKQDLKVARDSVYILGADVKAWQDSTQHYKSAYLTEKKRKKCWRAAALILGVRTAVQLWLKKMGSTFEF